MQAKTASTLFLMIGAVIVTLSAIFAGVFNPIYYTLVENLLILTPDNTTEIFQAWTTPPVPVYLKFYFFNVTNPEEVRNYGEKPSLTELGPYVYEEFREKQSVTFGGDETYVDFVNNIAYEFRPSLSNGTEDDEVMTLNTAMVLIAAAGHESRLFRLFVWPEIESTMEVFEYHTIGELLFDGVELPYFDFNFPGNLPILPHLNGTIYDILLELGVDEDEIAFLEPNRFSLYFWSNNTNDGVYRTHTGKNDMDKYMSILQWNHSSTLDYWNDEYCNMINGTDGSQFPPNVKKDDKLYLFTSELCRALYVEFEKEKEAYDSGVTLYRFIAYEEVLANHYDNPDNICYCYPDVENCLGAGMLNLGACLNGAPIIMSTPHFYNGDDDERAKFIGLNPSKELHETYLDLEPKTGFVFRGSKKIQVNIPLKKYGGLPAFKNVPEAIFPIFWGDEFAEGSSSDADDLKKAVNMPFTIVYSICGILISFGLAFVALGVWKRKQLAKSRPAEEEMRLPVKS